MKKLLILLITLTVSFWSYGQNCGMDDALIPPNGSLREGCESFISPYYSNNSGYKTPIFYDQNSNQLIPNGQNVTIDFKVNFIIPQRDDGTGNFDLSNQDHVSFLDRIVDEMNFSLRNQTNHCQTCELTPDNYSDTKLNLIVNYVTIRDNYAWNHLNDNQPHIINTWNKSYLMYIQNLSPSDGINIMMTVDELNFDHFVTQDLGGNPPSDLYTGYWYSSYPSSTELDHPAMCHTPDIFFNYFRNARVPEPYTAGAIEHQVNFCARTIIHEIGHYLGHTHSSYRGCNANYMDQGCSPWGAGECNWNDFKRTFDGCQQRLNMLTLMATNMRQYVPCDEVINHSINVSGIQAWRNDIRVYGDVVIEENSTLTVSCNMHFQNNARIFVKQGGKLVLDGAHLTTFCSDNKWAGIKVAGGNSDFDIEVKNGAIIENTTEAAITMWPTDSSDPGNGIAKIEYSTFNNVRGVVGFFARTSSNNSSYVKNCTVNNSRWGISNTNCHNIEVSENTFNETELECIFGSMGSYHIHSNNTFRSYQQDILFMNTSPTLSSVIENNKFYGINTGYHADGSVFAQNRIEFNQFFNGEIDILNDGHNSFRAWHNISQADLGGVSFSNGDRLGEYGFNTFNFNFIAQLPVGTNPGFNFYENCYNSSFTDVFIDGNVASIVQQGFGDAANNCFTHQGNNSVINDLGGNPDPFTYVEPDDNDIDCRDAINAHVNVNLDETGSPVAIPECFDPFTTPPTVAFSPCNPQEGAEEAARQWLLNKISEIESNPNLSESQKNKLLSIYRNCLKKVIGIITEIQVELEEFDDARSMYQPELSDDDKVMVYGLYIIEGDLMSASTYINSISSESEQLMDFKATQLSNLQRIQSNYIYEPSTSELASIKTIAEKDHPYAAYAKALYYAYTGEVLVSPLPVFVQNELENRSQKSIMNNKSVSINPNPFRDQLNVTLVGLDNPSIKVYNIVGKHQYSIDDNISTTINTSTWSEGVYVVQVLDGNELIKTQKVVLVK